MPPKSAAATEAAPRNRKAPEIDPKTGIVQEQGFAYKTVVFNAPADLQLSDLNEHPTIWRLVQRDLSGRGFVLAEWDHVMLRGEDYLITAKVSAADANQVVLFDIKRIPKPARGLASFNDGTFEVRWAQEGGFSYWRTADGVRMTPAVWPTMESCREAMFRNEYPPRA